jgi:hypothetical protein
VQIAGGIVFILVAIGRVAAVGWQLFGRHRDEMGPLWKVVSVIVACAIVAFFGVHLIFSSPAKGAQFRRTGTRIRSIERESQAKLRQLVTKRFLPSTKWKKTSLLHFVLPEDSFTLVGGGAVPGTGMRNTARRSQAPACG